MNVMQRVWCYDKTYAANAEVASMLAVSLAAKQPCCWGDANVCATLAPADSKKVVAAPTQQQRWCSR